MICKTNPSSGMHMWLGSMMYIMAKYIRVPYKRQWLSFTCGPVVLQMGLKYFNISIPRWHAIRLCQTARATGTSHHNLIAAIRSFGLHVHAHSHSTTRELEELTRRYVLVIVNYIEPAEEEGHYAIVVGMTKRYIVLHDPYHGPHFKIALQEFRRRWHGQHKSTNRRWLMAVARKRSLLKHS